MNGQQNGPRWQQLAQVLGAILMAILLALSGFTLRQSVQNGADMASLTKELSLRVLTEEKEHEAFKDYIRLSERKFEIIEKRLARLEWRVKIRNGED